jgi:hypothetical protein
MSESRIISAPHSPRRGAEEAAAAAGQPDCDRGDTQATGRLTQLPEAHASRAGGMTGRLTRSSRSIVVMSSHGLTGSRRKCPRPPAFCATSNGPISRTSISGRLARAIRARVTPFSFPGPKSPQDTKSSIRSADSRASRAAAGSANVATSSPPCLSIDATSSAKQGSSWTINMRAGIGTPFRRSSGIVGSYAKPS